MAGQLQDDERDNFCRVGQAIVGICSNIYRDALTKYISPTRILVIAQSDWSFWTGLFPGQKNHVRHASKDGYKYFDISLCYKFLRNLCAPRSIGFTVLKGRWGQQPNHSETGFVDDLERIRELRNVTYAHLPNTIIQNNEYITIWQTLEGICIRMKNHLNKDYPTELQKLSLYKMADWKELIELIERNKERDELIGECVRKIEAVEKELGEHRKEHVTMKASIETNKRKLETHEEKIRSHDEKILKLEKEKSEINPLKVSDLKIKLLKLSKDQKIKVSPLQKMGQYPLELMYSDVRIMENLHYESQRMNNDQRQGKEMKSIRDILYKNNEPAQRSFLLGKAGGGKTVFCQWLFKEWGNVQEPAERPVRKYAECLAEFDFVFFVKFRSVNRTLSNVADMICHDNFRYEKGCHQTVQHVLASDEYRCLIILDGLDEWRPNKHAKEELVHQHIPNIEDVSNCTFLISSRPWKFDFILDTLRSDDQVLEIQGFDGNGIKKITRDILINHYKLSPNSFEFEDKFDMIMDIYKKKKSFMQVPLLTVIVIQSFIEEKDTEKSLTYFYMTLIEILLKKYHQSHAVSEEMKEVCKANLNIGPLENFRRYKMSSQFINVLVDLGKVAYNDLNKNAIKDGEMSARKEIARFERNCEGIFSSDSDETASIKSLSTDDADDLQFEVFNCLNYNFVFQRDALESEIGETSLNFVLDVGILSLCEAPGSLNEENVNVEFIDKCVQELLAAVYIAAKNQDMKDFFVDIATTLEMANVVNFICGLSPSLGSKLSKHIVELTHKDFRISEYRKFIHTYQFHNFIGNVHDCLLVAHKELRQNESSRDKFEIFYFSDFLINPDMTIENVYRSEAVLSDKHLRLCSLFVSCINKFIPGSIVQCFRFRDPYVFMHKSRFLTTVNISGPCICEDYFDISSVISGNLWIDMRSTRHYSSEKDSASDMAIMLLLSYMPVLHTVSFWRVDLYNSPVVPFLTHNAKLSVLELCHVTFHNYEPESKTEECIAPCLSHLPQLSELWVNELTVYKPVSTPFLSYLPILETLSLNKVSIHLKEVLVSVAAPVLSFMPLLESLILKDVVINDSDVENKTDTGFLISQMPNLQSLKLTNVDLGRRHLELSSDMTRMETVICTKVNMSSRAWENFVESVIDIHKEYEIELNTCELNDKLKTKLFFSSQFQVLRNHDYQEFRIKRRWPLSQRRADILQNYHFIY